MAYGGLHPVVAVYATFLNRAFDQLLMDVALHKAGVTIVWTVQVLQGRTVPVITGCGTWRWSDCSRTPFGGPRDATRLREELREAVAINDAPTVVRFSKGSVGSEVEAIERLHDGVDIPHAVPRVPPKTMSSSSALAPCPSSPSMSPAVLAPVESAPQWLTPLAPARPQIDHRPCRPASHGHLHRRRRPCRRRGFAHPP